MTVFYIWKLVCIFLCTHTLHHTLSPTQAVIGASKANFPLLILCQKQKSNVITATNLGFNQTYSDLSLKAQCFLPAKTGFRDRGSKVNWTISGEGLGVLKVRRRKNLNPEGVWIEWRHPAWTVTCEQPPLYGPGYLNTNSDI